MPVLPLVSLLIIAVAWGFGWWAGLRWCAQRGVNERVSRWALACVVPAAALVLSIHLPALVTLFTPLAVVRPEPVAALFALLIWLFHRHTRVGPAADPQPEQSQRIDRVAADLGFWWIPVLITAGMYLIFVVEALSRFPTGYDGLNYHLPLAVGWMRAQRLDLVPGMLYESLPANALMIPFLLSFVTAEKVITVVRVPDAVLVAATIYGLTRAVGVSRLGCVLSVCVAMSVPMVIFQSVSSYIDLYGAAGWLCSLLALTWAARVSTARGRRGLLAIAGLAAGLALGSKSTYLLLVALLAPIAVAMDWIRPLPSRHTKRRPFRNLACFGGCVLVCSSFWFVRGTVQAGNPVYPFEVKVAGRTLLPGFDAADHVPRHTWAQKLDRWWDYPWRETNYTGTGYPYSVSNSLGAPYAAFVPVGLAVAMASWLGRRPRNQAQKWRLIYLLLTLTGGGIFLTAFTEVVRYILPIVLVSLVVAAVLIDRLAHRFPRSTGMVLTLSLLVTAATATIQPVRTFAGRWRDRQWDRNWFYQVPPLVDRLEPGSKIVNLGDPLLSYPLLGADYSNVVVPMTRWVHLTGSEQATAEQLRSHGIDYLWAREPWRDGWSEGLPLVKVFDDADSRTLATTPATRVYRVVEPPDLASTTIAQVAAD